MRNQKRIRDYGYSIGVLPTGDMNAITDVPDIQVGHVTLDSGDIKTGVTALVPHPGNLFQDKLAAACHVINGFGKSMGSIQIDELGTLETPIILTNTLSIGEACSGLMDYMLQQNRDIGKTTGTVNPVVCECNDGYLNDIRKRCVERGHIRQAIDNADSVFEEGSVGAGTGMSCYGLKGGIGSSSRIMQYAGGKYTMGVLVLTNMGKKQDLTLCGRPVGREIQQNEMDERREGPDGSIIILAATDMPLSVRQLKRLSRRAVVGLSRTGSHMDNGSGEVVISFTTANRIAHSDSESVSVIRMINDNHMNLPFRAVAECTEEAIFNSMITAETTRGINGHVRVSLKEFLTP